MKALGTWHVSAQWWTLIDMSSHCCYSDQMPPDSLSKIQYSLDFWSTCSDLWGKLSGFFSKLWITLDGRDNKADSSKSGYVSKWNPYSLHSYCSLPPYLWLLWDRVHIFILCNQGLGVAWKDEQPCFCLDLAVASWLSYLPHFARGSAPLLDPKIGLRLSIWGASSGLDCEAWELKERAEEVTCAEHLPCSWNLQGSLQQKSHSQLVEVYSD